jgi:DNA-binding MarR family transcriptional regulator
MATDTSSPRPPLPDGLTQTEFQAFGGLLRLHSTLVKQLDADLIAAHGLPLSSFEVLLMLANSPQGGLRMSDLAQRAFLSPSGMTRLVQRLAGQGLIEQRACDDDGRGSFAVMTPAGRERFEQAATTHYQHIRDRFLCFFSEDELRQMGDFFGRLSATGGDC